VGTLTLELRSVLEEEAFVAMMLREAPGTMGLALSDQHITI
jgi:hypothetical protein